ncbi:MAG: ACP S-malonyltransferase [Verrucomicrobia bacterium]|nr:ACP S-malonyltransferase [Verrucomicrobiota bacterium]MDA1086723.1 ACP S-malonyltransferase [Verrucomicrobiota bacterium]
MSRAFVFSGQGSQDVGMGRDLADAYPESAAVFERADEILGYGLSGICFHGPAEELTRTQHCQPGIFVMSVAAYEALKANIPQPAFAAAAGLSLGEWTALHVAGALSFEDALRALEARGRFMQQACDEEEGAMVGILALQVEDLVPICEQTGAEFANINSPGQIVLSGTRRAVEDARRLAQEAGARKAMMLNVAGAYHSRLMQGAAERMQEVLAGIDVKEPAVPVMSNATGAAHGDPDSIRRDLVAQITGCVQWVRNIEALAALGIEEYVECGPGKVLTGLIKRIDRAGRLNNIHDHESLKKTIEAIQS